MATRAIVGIILGILFAPVICILLTTLTYPTVFSNWFWDLFRGDFANFAQTWVLAGRASMVAPIFSSATFPISLVYGFGAGPLLTEFLPLYLAGMVTWVILGMWAGAIERNAGRGIGVAVGIWIGWLIIEIIWMAVTGTLGVFLDWFLAELLTLMIVILVAAIFGALTRSEEI